MTLHQFNKLDEIEQADIIWENGVLLGSRTDGAYKHILYQIDSFYVELHYHIEHSELIGARVFANPDHLHPYLEQMTIHLQELLISK
jgi:hypothetical protein